MGDQRRVPVARDARAPVAADGPREAPVLALVQRRFGNGAVQRAFSGPRTGLDGAIFRAVMLDAAGVASDGGALSNALLLAAWRDHAEGADPAAARNVRTSGGVPLPDAVRDRMERAFGHGFEHVRIHADSSAAQAATALDAHAFALGAHVFFGPGQWAPGSPHGDRLLAHELTHVQQHDRGELAGKTGVSDPSDRHEVEAYANEDRILSALSATSTSESWAPPPEATSAPSPDAPLLRYTEGQLAIARADRQSIEMDLQWASERGRSEVRHIRRVLVAARRNPPAADELVTVSYSGGSVRRVRAEDLEPLIARADQYLNADRDEEGARGGRGDDREGQGDAPAGQGNAPAGQGNAQGERRDDDRDDDVDSGTTDPDAVDTTRRDATGHWRTSRAPDITLALNQAGRLVRGTYAARERNRRDVLPDLDSDEGDGQMHMNRGTIEGELERDDARETVFRFRGQPTEGRRGEAFGGTIRVRGGGLLFIYRDNGDEYRFTRTDEEASDDVSGHLDESGRQDVEQPISPEQQHNIEQTAQRLHQIAQAYKDSLTRIGERDEVRRMDEVVVRIFHEFPRAQHDQLRQDLRQRLNRLTVREGSERIDALQMLRIMAWRFQTGPRTSPDGVETRELLQLERAADASAGEGPYFYRLRFILVGGEAELGLQGGVHIGAAHVEEVTAEVHASAPSDGGAYLWHGTYGMLRARVGAGLSVGANIGEATYWKYSEPSDQHWTRDDIPGPFDTYGVSGGLRAAENGPVVEAGITRLHGDGDFEPLEFHDLGINTDLVLGGGAGVGGAGGGGYIEGGDRSDDQRGPSEGPRERTVEVVRQDSEVVGFDTDVTTLNAAGRDALRRLCADNLRLLRTAGTTVRIDAYASRAASHDYNEGLTRMRANNTQSAMRTMIGDGATEAFTLVPHGERAAEAAGVRDGDDSPEWRRVDVTINGVLALRLRSARSGQRSR